MRQDPYPGSDASVPRLLLLSTPWPLFNRPSVQLGTLKSYVREHLPGVGVDALHFYLEVAAAVGYDLYAEISERTWLSECPYAALLYPDRLETIERFWKRRSAGLSYSHRVDFPNLCADLEAISDRLLDRVAREGYLLAGLSICFGQLTSSLYFARAMKRRAPGLKIVVGGPSCAGGLGESLPGAFPEIDFVIRGEGERPLLGLIEHLMENPEGPDPEDLSGLLSRNRRSNALEFQQLSCLDDLPIPNYREYFDALKALGPEKTFIPKIPLEASRGCWWRKALTPVDPGGCAFCNLNLQWEGYRSKRPEKVFQEIMGLSETYESLSLSFVDNLLPASRLDPAFHSIRETNRDFRLFAEIRADTQAAALSEMGTSGMREVQVGIEALSTPFLKKLNKGTTAIDNIEIMKHCETPGFPTLTGNLILEFPSSDEADVAETLRNLDFVFPFRPLKAAGFWLGYGSPVHRDPKRFGIQRTGNHPDYRHLFPPEILSRFKLMLQGYRGGLRRQRRLWAPVREKLNQWRVLYMDIHGGQSGDKVPHGWEPILSYMDGGRFLIIRERRSRSRDMNHRLRGRSREIYLYCETQRTLSELLARFPGLGDQKILAFLRMMVDKRLMFSEGDRYLSLAVPLRVR